MFAGRFTTIGRVIDFSDRVRLAFLWAGFKFPILPTIYRENSLRLLAWFIILVGIYFPISCRRPDFLLAFGPLVFGYPHLLASYRLMQTREKLSGFRPFIFLGVLTLISVLTNAL